MFILAPFNSKSTPATVRPATSAFVVHFLLTCPIDATANWLGVFDPPHTETLCPENVSSIKHAIATCATNCHLLPETSFLPTRLVDLGKDPASHPRLIDTADAIAVGTLDPSEPIRYAALSYCWGDETDASAQTKTEPSNLQERLRAIPVCDMSAVLQDAVTVCRTLDVRYLWVDALPSALSKTPRIRAIGKERANGSARCTSTPISPSASCLPPTVIRDSSTAPSTPSTSASSPRSTPPLGAHTAFTSQA